MTVAQETQGERIRRIRNERGMKQIFIARTAGVTQAHLSRIENDESGVTDNTLKKIAQALGVPFDQITVKHREKAVLQKVSIDEVLSDDATMIRFMGGNKPDRQTYEWVKRSLEVIRTEINKRRKASK